MLRECQSANTLALKKNARVDLEGYCGSLFKEILGSGKN